MDSKEMELLSQMEVVEDFLEEIIDYAMTNLPLPNGWIYGGQKRSETEPETYWMLTNDDTDISIKVSVKEEIL